MIDPPLLPFCAWSLIQAFRIPRRLALRAFRMHWEGEWIDDPPDGVHSAIEARRAEWEEPVK